MTHKPSWFIKLTDENGREGWGECSIIPGLSLDDPAAIAAFFSKAQTDPPQRAEEIPVSLPAVQFAFEMALNGLRNGMNCASSRVRLPMASRRLTSTD